MDFSNPVHKKVIGVIFIIFSGLGLLTTFFFEQFMDLILNFAQNEPDFDSDAMFVFDIISSVVWVIAIIFHIPRLIIGIGLVNQRSWTKIPALVYGIIGLINIPIGTLLGIYTILVFTSKSKEQEEF